MLYRPCSLISLFTVLFFTCASAQALTVAWDPPTTNVDGTPLTDLAGYRVKISLASGNYSSAEVFSAGSAASTFEFPTSANTAGRYCIVTAFDLEGNESDPSNEIRLPGGPDPRPGDDSDGDGFSDNDNCPFISNADQADANGNGIGDACETRSRVHADFDGDGSTDLGFVQARNAHIFTNVRGTPQDNAVALSSSVVGAGDALGDGRDEIVAILNGRSGKKAWRALNLNGTVARELGTFGGRSDSPILGCHALNRTVMTTTKRGRSGFKGIKFFVRNGSRSLKLPKGVARLSCTSGLNGTSNYLALVKAGRLTTGFLYNRLGRVVARAPLTAAMVRPMLFAVPAFGSSGEKIGAIYQQNGVFKVAVYNTNQWNEIALSAPLGSIQSFMTGVFKQLYPFLAVSTGQRTVIVPLAGSAASYDAAVTGQGLLLGGLRP